MFGLIVSRLGDAPQVLLDPSKPYLLAQWNAGCRTGMRLYEDLQRQGYRGGRSTVLGYLTQLRKAQGLAPRTRTVQPTPPVTDPTVPRLNAPPGDLAGVAPAPGHNRGRAAPARPIVPGTRHLSAGDCACPELCAAPPCPAAGTARGVVTAGGDELAGQWNGTWRKLSSATMRP